MYIRHMLRRMLTTAAIAIPGAVMLAGCESEETSVLRDAVSVDLQVNACHEQYLGFYGSDANATITRPPRRADSSVIVRESSGVIRYRYCPTRSFIGTDSVVILITQSAGREEKTIRYRMSK